MGRGGKAGWGKSGGAQGKEPLRGKAPRWANPRQAGGKDRVIPTYSKTPLLGLPQDNHCGRVERLGFLTPAEARAPVLTPETA